jgi:Na+-transporting methylmalonyl-CoA/oxaloacetate decarboxylase gamma subunit
MKKNGLLLVAWLIATSTTMFGQGAKNIKISEVLVNNATSLQDEFGQHGAWMELANTAFSTYDIRGMYLTTDRTVLDKSLSAPQRISRMCIIPSGDTRTVLSAKAHLILYLNSIPQKGATHLAVPVDSVNGNWIALYDGNGIDLIDSVSVPKLKTDESYALFKNKQGQYTWKVMEPDMATPGIDNEQNITESKAAKLKRDDPHGFGITVLSMGIVFFCLALLFVFFSLFGKFMMHKSTLKKAKDIQPVKVAVEAGEMLHEAGHKTNVILKDGLKTKGIDKEIYMAVIAMALKQYQDDVHDVESGIITITPKHSKWTRI